MLQTQFGVLVSYSLTWELVPFESKRKPWSVLLSPLMGCFYFSLILLPGSGTRGTKEACRKQNSQLTGMVCWDIVTGSLLKVSFRQMFRDPNRHPELNGAQAELMTLSPTRSFWQWWVFFICLFSFVLLPCTTNCQLSNLMNLRSFLSSFSTSPHITLVTPSYLTYLLTASPMCLLSCSLTATVLVRIWAPLL